MVIQLKGIGKQMPITLWCFTLVSITLVGIPPTSGFVSKWYLASGAIEQRIPYIWWFGPVILLISALLTAGYLLSITVKGFFPEKEEEKLKESSLMTIPILCLTVVAILLGMFPNYLIDYINRAITIIFC